MNRSQGRNPSGRGAGKGSDKNKPSFSKPAGGAKRGSANDRFDKKPFDRDGKKPYGSGSGSSDKPQKPYGKKESFGDKPERGSKFSDKPFEKKGFGAKSARTSSGRFGDKDERSDKPYGKKEFGAKSARPASKSYGDRNERSDKPYGKKDFGDKPARAPKSYGDRNERADKPYGKKEFGDKKPGAKSSYKDYEDRGKRDRQPKFGESEPAERKTGGKRPRTTVEKKPQGPKALKASFEKKKGFGNDSDSDFAPKRTSKKSAPKTADSAPQSGIRLNKFIANSGVCSRREADVLIQNGVVMVNGKIMDEVGYRVQPDDVVKFDGRTIIPEKPVYLLLNKPKDYITTAEDPQGRKTVMALIQGACKERLFPVGRLDRQTTGLLLFTNDGEMADKLMHPRKRIKKIYMVELDKNLKHDHLSELREGITLEDGPIKPDVVEYADGPKPDKKVIGVEIHSGRNRIVRRMFEHFGYKVVKLDRVYYAGLTKKNLPRGHYRMLEPIEVNMLKML